MIFNKLKPYTALYLAVSILIIVLFIPSVFAQEGESANLWVKFCNTDEETNQEVCLITAEKRTPTGQLLVSVGLREISDEERKTLILSVPPGMLIQPGLTIDIDEEQERQAKYGICFPNACYSELVVNEDVVDGFKQGKELRITTYNQQAKKVPHNLSLIGFTETYEGEPTNPEDFQRRQQGIQKRLVEQADAARQKLLEEQRKASESTTLNTNQEAGDNTAN